MIYRGFLNSHMPRVVVGIRPFRPVRVPSSWSRQISTEVYIKGLGDVTDDQMARLMAPYGVLAKCSISKQMGARGTHCTLTFADISGAIAAVDALDETVIFGRRVNVKFSTKRADDKA